MRATALAQSRWLATRPVATRYAGLCRRDELVVIYADAPGVDPKLAYKPVRARSLRVDRRYRITRPELTVRKLNWDVKDMSPYDGECAGASPADRGWLESDSDYVAAAGYGAMTRAVEAIRDNEVKIGGCEEAEDRAKCDARYLAGFREVADSGNLESIDACEGEKEYSCYELRSEDWAVTVRLKSDGRVDSVEVEGINHIL